MLQAIPPWYNKLPHPHEEYCTSDLNGLVELTTARGART